MPGPYRDIYNKKEIIYGTYQQTARGSAQRGEHDGPRLPDRQGRDRRHPQAGHRRLHRRTRAYQSKGAENSEYSAREAADILCEALDCECVQVIGRKFVLFKQKKKESAYTAVLAK